RHVQGAGAARRSPLRRCMAGMLRRATGQSKSLQTRSGNSVIDILDRITYKRATGVGGTRSLDQEGIRMDRRRFLKLAGAGGGIAVLGSAWGARRSPADTPSIPTVDRLVLTNVVDNVYDVFARGGKLAGITVQRTPLARAGEPPLLAEHGLAFHLE